MKKSLLSAFLLVQFGMTSYGQCSLDQDQPQWNGGTSERNLPGYYDWESFTAGMTGALCEVDVMFCNSNTQLNGTGTLDIYDGVGDGGTLLTSQSVTVNGTAYNLNTPFWQSFMINTPPSIVTGQSYTWKFTPVQNGGLPDPYLIQVNIPDVYAGGVSYGFGTGGDITFRTYADVSLGVNSPAKEMNLFIYPQPAQDVIHLDSPVSLSGGKYFIYDEYGRIVIQGMFDTDKPFIDLHELASGIYFLKVGEMELSKIVKQ